MDSYFNLYDQASMSNGQLDFDKLDALQGDYRAAHPGIDAKVDQVTGIHDDPTLRAFRNAQKEAKDYYALPAYLGMDADQSQRASRTLSIANGLVSTGAAPTMKAALAQLLSTLAVDDVMLARRALRSRSNPDRKQFRRDHPLFATFYSDAIAA